MKDNERNKKQMKRIMSKGLATPDIKSHSLSQALGPGGLDREYERGPMAHFFPQPTSFSPTHYFPGLAADLPAICLRTIEPSRLLPLNPEVEYVL